MKKQRDHWNPEETQYEIANELEEIEAIRLTTPYIILPCCIVAIYAKHNDVSGYVINVLSYLLISFLGNAVIFAVKTIVVNVPVAIGVFNKFSAKAEKFITKALLFICHFVLPAVAVWMIHQKIG